MKGYVNISLVYLFCFIILYGCVMFDAQRKHLLMVLLSLELIVLVMFLMLVLMLSDFYNEISFSHLFLTFCVCEDSLGLSILVFIVRSHGNDYLGSLIVLR